MKPTLQHYRQIDIIRQAENAFFSETGIKPFDISHWNSGEIYKKELMKTLILPKTNDYIDYVYSYSYNQNIKSQILNKHKTINSECVLFNSATSAIATICTALKAMNYYNVCLLCPAYFSVFEQLKILNFNVECINYKYDGKYHIPFELIDKSTDIIWITQPVFSTGTYISSEELQQLFSMPYHIVCDGSMCDTTINMFDFIIDCSKVFLLFSPQKVIGLNGIKFSYILCSKILASVIEDWEDVVAGGLTNSNVIAIKHYLSENYVQCVEMHNNYVKKSHLQIDKIVSNSNNTLIKCGDSINSSYETITIKKYPYMSQITLEFIYDFIRKTHVSVTPGCINGFDQQNGFCFRINHTLDSLSNITALNRVISYLQDR